MHREDDPNSNKNHVVQNNTQEQHMISWNNCTKSKWILIVLNISVFKKQTFPLKLLVNQLFNSERDFYVSFVIPEICVDIHCVQTYRIELLWF